MKEWGSKEQERERERERKRKSAIEKRGKNEFGIFHAEIVTRWKGIIYRILLFH